jgi:hypothetical protein
MWILWFFFFGGSQNAIEEKIGCGQVRLKNIIPVHDLHSMINAYDYLVILVKKILSFQLEKFQHLRNESMTKR